MKNPQINKFGTKRWYNEKGELHRDGDKPAIEWIDGDKTWFKNGKLHRDRDKPAIEIANGGKYWYQNGELHRNGDKPAIECANGRKEWYQNGKLHRDGDKPALELVGGSKEWHKSGELVDRYLANFGCFEPKTREEALKRLNAKKRRYSRKLYLADINRMFPEKAI